MPNRVRLTVILFVGVLLSACATRSISHRELVELLEIHQWTVPMPKDDRLIWAFEIRDAEGLERPVTGIDDWMDRRPIARITFMPTGEGNVYRFWFQQPDGTSCGEARIDPCGETDDTAIKCPSQFEIEWFPRAIRVGDGRTYVVAEITDSDHPATKRRVVLYQTKYRLEDMLDQSSTPPNNRLNPTVGTVTALAKTARSAPVPPAGYPARSADLEDHL